MDHEVVVIGAGFSGIGAAIKLDDAGFHDYVVLEAGDGVGGAWHFNTYPGIAVDIPSFSYQFSFETRGDWSRVYAPGRELKAYAEHCVDKYGIRDRIRLNTSVTGARYDEAEGLWHLATGDGGEVVARFVVGATGVFTQPKPPEIEGLDAFAGTAMHSARWDHDVDLAGKRVGIIGTGASAIQIIPAIAPEVEHLTVFQRTPIWCLPKPDAPLGGIRQRLLEKLPGARFATRMLSQAFVELTFVIPAHLAGRFPKLVEMGTANGHKHLKAVQDPETRAKLTPEYSLGCKRPSFHNEYLPTFNRANVTLETERIESGTPAGIRVAGGTEHELDVLIFATGFKVFEHGNMPAFEVRGVDGLSLEAFWDEHRFQAYEGVSVPGFPNMFSILGPYGFNGQSYFGLIETQMRHITRLLKQARKRGASRVEVRPEANRRYHEQVLGRRDDQIFFTGSCGLSNSYYFDKHGDVPFRPSLTLEAAWRSARFDLGDYAFTA